MEPLSGIQAMSFSAMVGRGSSPGAKRHFKTCFFFIPPGFEQYMY